MAPDQFGVWDTEYDGLKCRGHHSVFRDDGSLIGGPADAGIRAFPVEFNFETNRGVVTIEQGSLHPQGKPHREVRRLRPIWVHSRRIQIQRVEPGFEPLSEVGGMVAVNVGHSDCSDSKRAR